MFRQILLTQPFSFGGLHPCNHPTITHHETPHRPQDRLRIQGIARLGGKPQPAGAFPECDINQRFNRTDNRSVYS